MQRVATNRPAAGLILLFVLTMLLWWAAPQVGAHSVLLRAAPAANSGLNSAPPMVELEFNEPVKVRSVTVTGEQGERVDLDDAVTSDDGRTISVSLPRDLPPGTYTVTWRVEGADSHRVDGSLSFAVKGAAPPVDEEPADEPPAEQPGDAAPGPVTAPDPGQPAGPEPAPPAGGPLSVVWLNRFDQGVLYAVTLLAGGLVLFLYLIWNAAGPAAITRVLQRWGTLAALGAVLLTLLGVALQGGFNTSTWVRLGGLALIIVILAAGPRGGIAGWLAVAGALAALGSFSLTGHAVTAEPAVVRRASTLVHLWAGGLWFGGLAGLALVLRHLPSDQARIAPRLVARFSRWAAGASIAVLVAGGIITAIEVRPLTSLWTNVYGILLTAKVIFVLTVLAVALYNNRRLVPRLAASTADQPQLLMTLRQTIAMEITGLVMALLVTGLLVGVTPPRNLPPDPSPARVSINLDDADSVFGAAAGGATAGRAAAGGAAEQLPWPK